jgi:lipoprotein signal peptidase
MTSTGKNVYLKPFFSWLLLFSGVTTIVSIDQFLKHKIRSDGGFYVCNANISFNLPIFPFIFWFIFAIFLLACFFYFNYLIKNGLLKPFLLLPFIFILGGALSNGLDRLSWGCITDFFSLGLTFLPLFNLADVTISLGSLLLLILITSKKTTFLYK